MVENLIKKYIKPLLKRYGFKKINFTWNRSKNGLVQVIDFQLSRFSSSGRNDFTINLGVFDPNIWSTCWGKEIPKFVNEEDCFPRIRIGELLSNSPEKALDHWWVCNCETNEEKLGKEIIELLEQKCLPFLDRMLTHNSVVTFYSSYSACLMPIEKIYLAIIKHSIGNIDSSINLLNEVRSISKN